MSFPGNSSCTTELAAIHLADTHDHLDLLDFGADRAVLLQRSRAPGVKRQVMPDVYRENQQQVWDLAQAEDGLYAALDLHPTCLAWHRPQHLDDLCQQLQRLCGETKLCAVDETGLDYYLEHLDRDIQQALFEAQLRLAAEFRLPALIHVRRAHAATIATLKRIRLERRGIIHALAGSHKEAREYLKPGFCFDLGGAPTWPRANHLRKVVAELPVDAIVLETDAPDTAPSMHPGQRNSPEYLPDICRALVELCGVDAEELAAGSSRNATELLGWN